MRPARDWAAVQQEDEALVGADVQPQRQPVGRERAPEAVEARAGRRQGILPGVGGQRLRAPDVLALHPDPRRLVNRLDGPDVRRAGIQPLRKEDLPDGRRASGADAVCKGRQRVKGEGRKDRGGEGRRQ